MRKPWLAFFLGLFSFLMLAFVGETAGPPASWAALAACFRLCQFLLSRKTADAHRTDWLVMPALGAVPGILLSAGEGTHLGAVAASLTAGRP